MAEPPRKKPAAAKKVPVHKRPPAKKPPVKKRTTAKVHARQPDQRAGGDARATSRTSRINPRIRERKVAVARDAGRHRLFVLTSVLVVPALFVTAFVLLHTSVFSINTIRISGEVNTSTQSILRVSGLSTHPPLIDVNPTTAEAKIETLPWVATAVVERNWLRGVSVRVVEHVPVAEIAKTKTSFELFSDSGRALGYSEHSMTDLPQVKSVANLPIPGHGANSALSDEIKVAGAVPVRIVPDIREITSTRKDGLVAQLSSGVSVIFGTTASLHDKMVALVTLLDNHVALAGVSTIDLRVPASPVLSS